MGALNLSEKLEASEPLTSLLKELTGVVIPSHKGYLFNQRLGPLMSEYDLGSADDLVARVKKDAAVRRAFIHALTTHETSFFRDLHPFEALRRDLLPALLGRLATRQRAGRPPNAFTVWSSACSSGKEAYTIAMLIDEVLSANPQFGLTPDRVRILGTDISEPVLAEAREGKYSKGEGLRGLPKNYTEQYFDEKDGVFEVKSALRRRCTFRRLDITKQFTLGPFDLVMVRNVLIYFDPETKRKTLERIHQTLGGDGVLLLGSSESLEPDVQSLFESKLSGRTRFYVKQAE